MTATLLTFPKERVNLDDIHHGGARILHIPQRQPDPLEDAMVAYYRWVRGFTNPFNL